MVDRPRPRRNPRRENRNSPDAAKSEIPDFRTLDLSRLALFGARLANALSTLRAGADLPDDARRRYGARHLGSVFMALCRCHDECCRLGVDKGLWMNGGTFADGVRCEAVAPLLSGVLQLWGFIESQHSPPNETAAYPHLPALDWVEAFPPDAVLEVQLGAKALAESVVPVPAMSAVMTRSECGRRFGLCGARGLIKHLEKIGARYEVVNRQKIRVALADLPPRK